ncbi:MAG TPA: LegC family aminotransferase [Candidatus Krumholzibacteria bacterium]|nr:LegC family aminotransferase [Candidatus Krumholzibacteria bacterium]HPD70984.1 LegC family aminotransferase [Candidatus Krumholzibacteria bacterium]HRY39316.1 LegC family aminotransferase [Candidatus Krumholzibacteria bacterium]
MSPDFIPLSVPVLAGNEWTYVRECLDTGWVSSAGPFVTRFETELAGATGAAHAVACTSGTAALHVSLRLAGVGRGDLVLAPTVTFVAPINAIRYLGADPVFFDCDRHYNLDPEPLRQFLDAETEQREGSLHDRSTGRRIGALLTVAVFGHAGDWQDLYASCRERGLAVVEDATEALGTRYTSGGWSGRHAGTNSEFGCFSFNGNKIITTGGGGAIVTDRADHAGRARYLTQQAKDDPIAFRHDEVGYNYRLTNLAAALGVGQLELLEHFVARKRANLARYGERLAHLPWCELAPAPPYARNNHWMYPLYLRDGKWRGRARELVAALGAEGIETRPLWMLNHLQRPYRGCRVVGDRRARDLVANTVNLPCSVDLTPAAVDRVCEVLAHV